MFEVWAAVSLIRFIRSKDAHSNQTITFTFSSVLSEMPEDPLYDFNLLVIANTPAFF